MLEFIQSFMAQFAYVGMVGVLLAAGLGVPLPEDIPLMVGGLLSAQGVTNVYLIFAFAYVSILVGDFMIFSMGRRLGPKALQKPWAAKVLTPQRQQQLNAHFQRHGTITIVVARHMAGLRAPCFLMAGVARMSPLQFLVADGLGACLSVPLFIWVGYKFGENLEYILDRIKEYQQTALVAGVVVVAVGLLVRRTLRNRRAAAEAAEALQAAAPGTSNGAGATPATADVASLAVGDPPLAAQNPAPQAPAAAPPAGAGQAPGVS